MAMTTFPRLMISSGVCALALVGKKAVAASANAGTIRPASLESLNRMIVSSTPRRKSRLSARRPPSVSDRGAARLTLPSERLHAQAADVKLAFEVPRQHRQREAHREIDEADRAEDAHGLEGD